MSNKNQHAEMPLRVSLLIALIIYMRGRERERERPKERVAAPTLRQGLENVLEMF